MPFVFSKTAQIILACFHNCKNVLLNCYQRYMSPTFGYDFCCNHYFNILMKHLFLLKHNCCSLVSFIVMLTKVLKFVASKW